MAHANASVDFQPHGLGPFRKCDGGLRSTADAAFNLLAVRRESQILAEHGVLDAGLQLYQMAMRWPKAGSKASGCCGHSSSTRLKSHMLPWTV